MLNAKSPFIPAKCCYTKPLWSWHAALLLYYCIYKTKVLKLFCWCFRLSKSLYLQSIYLFIYWPACMSILFIFHAFHASSGIYLLQLCCAPKIFAYVSKGQTSSKYVLQLIYLFIYWLCNPGCMSIYLFSIFFLLLQE